MDLLKYPCFSRKICFEQVLSRVTWLSLSFEDRGLIFCIEGRAWSEVPGCFRFPRGAECSSFALDYKLGWKVDLSREFSWEFFIFGLLTGGFAVDGNIRRCFERAMCTNIHKITLLRWLRWLG